VKLAEVAQLLPSKCRHDHLWSRRAVAEGGVLWFTADRLPYWHLRLCEIMGPPRGGRSVVYASIRKYRQVRSPEQIAHRVEKGFLPILKALPGFKTYYLIVGGDELTTVSLFDNQQAALASIEKAATWVKENLPDLHQGPSPEVSAGEVRIVAVAEPPARRRRVGAK
jgi:hypothetical protein